MGQNNKKTPVCISPWICVVIAMAFFILPWKWVLAWIIASTVHELFHLAAIKICNGTVWQINIMLSGTVIQTDLLLPWQEALCALAGPAGSAMLLLIARWLPQAALCGCLQCAYNLLPVYPNDGGRFIKAVLERIITQSAAIKAIRILNHAVLLSLLAGSICISICYRLGPVPVLVVMILWWKTKKSLH